MRIAHELLLKSRINLFVQYLPFVGNLNLAMTLPVNKHCAKLGNNGQYFLFPSALLKQASNKLELFENSMQDVEINVNSKVQFYFGMGMIQREEYDFEQVMLHEITHGLGLGTTLQPEKVGNDSILIPKIVHVDGYSYFAPISIYDGLLKSSNSTQFAQVGAILSTFPKQLANIEEFYRLFLQNQTAFSAAKQLHQLASSAQLSFNARPGRQVKLHSTLEFIPGASVSHISTYDPIEFLMKPFIRPGISLETSIINSQYYSIFGPETLRMLETMGYATRRRPFYRRMEVATEFGKAEYDPSVSRYLKNPVLI